MKRLLSLTLLICIPAFAADRPNILLLMAEDMSSRVGAFGDPVAHTPNLDALALQGVRYTSTFTAAGVCAPSRAAHILGMHQISTGTQHMRTFRGPLGSYKSVPPAHAKAYPELLRAAGYYTYTDNKLDYQFSSPLPGSGPFTIWELEGDSDADWTGRAPGQPFFGFRNFGVTHESGIFPPLGTMPNSFMHFVMQVLRAFRAGDVETPTDPSAITVPPYFPDTPTVRADMARHYDNIAQMDVEVGAILQQLEADGLAESTIVIWTTDHGDGLPRGKRELYDSGLKVPMIIRWPEAFRPQGVKPGSLDSRLISFIDFAPTILKLAGVDVPGHLQGQDFASPDAPPREYIFASRDRIDEVQDRQRAARGHHFKYIRSWHPDQAGGHDLEFRDNMDMMRELKALYAAGELSAQQSVWFEAPGEERLFELGSDPFELNDVSGDPRYQADLSRLRKALNRHLNRVGDWSDAAEADMLARFQPDGEQQLTPVPRATVEGGLLTIIPGVEGSSLGYRTDGGPWRVYSAPVPIAQYTGIEVRGVRYGWKESEIVELTP